MEVSDILKVWLSRYFSVILKFFDESFSNNVSLSSVVEISPSKSLKLRYYDGVSNTCIIVEPPLKGPLWK